jgi:hypothetical protein
LGFVVLFHSYFNQLMEYAMIRIKDHKTPYMFDPFEYLGPKRRKMLDDSWAGVFRDHVRHVLPVHLLAKHYSSDNGRPTNELGAMMGAMLLQHMHDLTDQETAEQIAFNIQWHYALDITSNSDSDAYVCHKSIWTTRELMTEHGLYNAVFEATGQKLAKVFKVDTSLQRIDSVHIFSNMRHLGRIGIFVATIKKFFVNLKRHHRQEFDSLSQVLKDRYLRKEEESAFAMVKPSESTKTLQMVGNDLFFLVERFRSHDESSTMSTYQLMVRVLKEQCIVEHDEATCENRVTIKANKDVPSDSLQNPSDPDAGYDGHKGKGYQVQIAETYSNSEDKDNPQLSLITHIDVEPAHASDANALLPYIETTRKKNLAPREILADSAYGSDNNHEQAGKEGIELIAPTMGKRKDALCSLADFEFTAEGAITACPQGHKPVKVKKKKGRFSIAFEMVTCSCCPQFQDCPSKSGKQDRSYIRYDEKVARLAQRRIIERTDDFKERYRFRAGVEATMSQLDRRTGIKHLRVRGMKAVCFAATLKASALNILRAAAFRKRQNMGKTPGNLPFGSTIELIRIVKERLFTPMGNFIGGQGTILDLSCFSASN